MSPLGSALPVLLVEDDPGDRLLVVEVFEQHGVSGGTLATVEDGQEALDYLYRRGEHVDTPRPALILLDLNLPKVNGREVLETIKMDRELASIPVVVLTTSEAEEDIARVYAAHANAFVSKPMDWDAFTATVQRIGNFYFDIARLPATPH